MALLISQMTFGLNLADACAMRVRGLSGFCKRSINNFNALFFFQTIIISFCLYITSTLEPSVALTIGLIVLINKFSGYSLLIGRYTRDVALQIYWYQVCTIYWCILLASYYLSIEFLSIFAGAFVVFVFFLQYVRSAPQLSKIGFSNSSYGKGAVLWVSGFCYTLLIMKERMIAEDTMTLVILGFASIVMAGGQFFFGVTANYIFSRDLFSIRSYAYYIALVITSSCLLYALMPIYIAHTSASELVDFDRNWLYFFVTYFSVAILPLVQVMAIEFDFERPLLYSYIAATGLFFLLCYYEVSVLRASVLSWVILMLLTLVFLFLGYFNNDRRYFS